MLSKKSPDDHALAGILKDLLGLNAQLIENAPGQPLKAQDIDIHKGMVRMQPDQMFIGLHIVLLRHKHKKTAVRMGRCLLKHHIIQVFGLAGTAAADDKL